MRNGLWSGRTVLGCVAAAVLAVMGVGCQDHIQMEADRLRGENSELRQELESTRAALESAEADRARLVEEILEVEDRLTDNPFAGIDDVTVEAGVGYIAVQVPGDILFDPGRVDIRREAEQTLNEVAEVLQAEYGNNTVRVEGYTDTDPIRHSDWTDNLELSAHRAMAVHRHLESRGLPAERLYSAGFGETRPRETKELSRRVEIVVVMTPDEASVAY